MLFRFGQNNKGRLFNNFLAKRINTANNSLIFKIDSVINVTKNGETKIYKTVEELKSLAKYKNGNEGKSDSSIQSNLNSLIETAYEED